MSRYLNLADRFGMTVPGKPVLGRLPAEQLNIPREDIAILRALGEKKHRYANDPVMETRRKLWRATNDLKMIKPPLYINEICWEEMNGDGELNLLCTHPFAIELEDFLRKELYCFEHGLGDCIIEDLLESPLVVYDSGFQIDEDVVAIRTDRNSEIVSRHFKPYILHMDDVEKIKTPEVYVDDERTQQYTDLMREIFDGILEVRVVGARGLWFTPWDYLIRVMGIDETLYNLVDEPDFVEAVVKRYVDCAMVRMEQYRKLGIWASNNYSCRVGSGGYGIVSDLAAPEQNETNCDTR